MTKINNLSAVPERIKEVWTEGGVLLLSAEIDFFLFSAECKSTAVKRINHYYEHMFKRIIKYCKIDLLPRIIVDYKAAEESGEVFTPITVRSRSKLCYNGDGILSLYSDINETSGVGSVVTRLSDVWSIHTGCPLTMDNFFPKGFKYKKLLKRYAAQEVRRLTEHGLAAYYQNPEKNISRHFKRQSFYITPEGFTVYFQPATIASRFEGVTAFTLKWSERGPVNPAVNE